MYRKICKVCKRPFKSKARNTQYCSKSCIKKRSASRVKLSKKRESRRLKYQEDKDINRLIQRAYALAILIGDVFIKRMCASVEVGHVCEGALELHHIDHNPFNNSLDNLVWLCKKSHARRHSMEVNADLLGDLKRALARNLIKDE